MRTVTTGERLAGLYARSIVALRVFVVLFWVLAAVAALVFLPPLGGSGSAPLGDIVPVDAKAIRAQERALQLFGSTVGTDTAVVQRNVKGLSPDEVKRHVALAKLVRDRQLPAEFGGVLAAIPVPNAAIPGVRWGEDGTGVITYLFLDPELNLVERNAVAHRYASLLRAEPGTTTAVTGAGPARLEQFDEIDSAIPLVEIATLLVILLIVALYFRSLGAPLVTLLTGAIAYVVAVRLIAWFGERAGVTAPSEIEPVLVVLLLGLVTDYTVFFLAEGRRALLRGDGRVPAARAATRRIAPIVATAGIVVAAGAASLLAGEMDFFRVFGPGLALSAIVVTLVCVTFVPAVLGLAGPRLLGRRVREAERPDAEPPGAVAANLGNVGTDPTKERWRMRFAGSLGALRASRRHARDEGGRVSTAFGARLLSIRFVSALVVVGCVVLLVAAASLGSRADLAVSFIPSLPKDAETRQGAAAAAAAFGPGVLAPTDVVVERWGIGRRPDRLVALQRELSRQPGVAAVIGPSQPAGTPLRDLVVAKGGNASRYAVVLDSEPTGAKAVDDLERLQERMPGLLREAGLPAETRVAYAGETALSAETVDALTGDLRHVAIATLIVTFLLLALFLRALVAPLLLLLASVLAFAASFGLATLVMPEVVGTDEFVYYVPLVAAVLLIGLGSDYNVFIAGRIREEARRRRMREAVAVGAPSASRAISVAGLTLAGTFALLALVPLRPFRELAVVMTIGVLVDALFVRPVLIPALIAVTGRAAWWPGRVQRPPATRAIVERIAERTGLPTARADRVLTATLATLGERIPEREADELARQLPDGLRVPLQRTAEACEPFACDVFIDRVAVRADLSHSEARDHARSVVATLADVVGETELDYVRAALSDDFRWLFGDSMTAADASPSRFEREGERAVPGV